MKYKHLNKITLAHLGWTKVGILVILLLAGCAGTDDVTPTNTSTIDITDESESATPEGNTDDAADEDDLIENQTFSSTVKIEYAESGVTITNPLEGLGVTVTQENGDVTVEATVSEVAYELSGKTTDGSFKIYSEKKLELILNGANITNSDGPAINIQTGKTIFVVMNEGTTNTLTDSETYEGIPDDEDAKAAFFSEGQLVFSGSGSLSVQGNYKHGICSDDYVRIREGTIIVTGAVKDGIHVNDAFISDGGVIDITAPSDGIECEEGYIVINSGEFYLNVGDDGIAASYETDNTIDPYLTINGGTFEINSSEGEGIESKSTLTINDGEFTINTADDGLNAGSALYINGGKLYVKSTTNDAIDSNGILTVTGGITVAIGASSPEAGFDCDNNTFKITGGTLLGIGGSTSQPSSTASTQRSVILGSYSSGNYINIQSADSVEALTFFIPQSYTTMLYSSAKLKPNTTYTVYTGGSVTNEVEFNGLVLSGEYSGGTATSTSFTTSSMVTSVGGSTGPGGGPRGG